LTEVERIAWLAQLHNDEKAIRNDLPDLTFFMLATGVRIGEALAAIWSEVDFDTGTVEINPTLVRVNGEGLLRKGRRAGPGRRVGRRRGQGPV